VPAVDTKWKTLAVARLWSLATHNETADWKTSEKGERPSEDATAGMPGSAVTPAAPTYVVGAPTTVDTPPVTLASDAPNVLYNPPAYAPRARVSLNPGSAANRPLMGTAEY